MKRLALILALLSSPAWAQSTETFSKYFQNLPTATIPLGLGDHAMVLQGGVAKQVSSTSFVVNLPAVDVATATPPILCNGTDQTANLVALLVTLQNAGTGGELDFHACAYLFNNATAVVIPNDGGNPPNQVTFRFSGSGYWGSGQSNGTVNGGTVFDLRSGNALGQIQTYGNGTIEFDHITLTNGGSSTGTPFFYTTLTTPNFHQVSVVGASNHVGTSADQDFWVLGGTTAANSGTNGHFAGYIPILDGFFANNIRRLVYCRVYCNAGVIINGYVQSNSGSNFSGAKTISSITNPGSGYAPGDFIILSGGTAEKTAIIKVLSVGGGGSISTAAIQNDGNYTATPSNPVAQSSTTGAGTSATFNMTWAANGSAVEFDGFDIRTASAQPISGWTVSFSCEQVNYVYCAKVPDGQTNQFSIDSFDGSFGVNSAVAVVYFSLGSVFNTVFAGRGVPGASSLVKDDNGCTNATGSNTVISSVQNDQGCLPNQQFVNLIASGSSTFAGNLGIIGPTLIIQPATHQNIGATAMQSQRAVADGSAVDFQLNYGGNLSLSNTFTASIVSSNSYVVSNIVGVSCSAGTVSTATLTINNGIVTHC